MKLPITRMAAAVSAVLVPVLAAGCSGGPRIVPVSGQVLIDGKPLPHGFVQVVPEGFRPASGKIGPDGRFQLTTLQENDGCVVGEHPVAVIGVETINPQSQRWHAPKTYTDPTRSKLTVSIEGKTTDLTINLTWAGGKPFVEHYSKE